MSETQINRDTGTVKKIKNKEPFSFANVKRIFLKDWMEIRGNRELLLPIILLPVMFVSGGVIMYIRSGRSLVVDWKEVRERGGRLLIRFKKKDSW